MQAFIKFLLSSLGLVRKQEFQAKVDLANDLSKTLAKREEQLSLSRSTLLTTERALTTSQEENRKLRDAAQQERDRQDWCLPSLVEFPPGTPASFHEKTWKFRSVFLRDGASPSDVSQQDQFASPAQWALYWCVVHACRSAANAVVAKVEDGVSGEFLKALASEVGTASRFSAESGNLQIAYSAIFEHAKPAVKEADVGADILLIVAGQQVAGSGFARAFWIQAKKAEADANQFILHYDQKNTRGLQVDALTKVHRPNRGSFGLYIQYSRLPYVPAVSVSNLPRENGVLAADLSDLGLCMPEYIVAHAGAGARIGSFADTAEILAYLDEVSDMKPFYVATVTAEGVLELDQKRANNQLLSTITGHYRQRLGLNRVAENDSATHSQRDRDFEM